MASDGAPAPCARGGAGGVARDRIPLVPLRLRDTPAGSATSAPPTVGDVMVSVRNRSPAPCFAFWSAERVLARADRKSPQPRTSPRYRTVLDRSGSYRVEDGGLREDVGGPKAGWMLWIAFDFGRMTLVAFHQNRRGDAGKRDGRREEQRTARHQVLGLPHVGDDLFRRLLRAGADAGERERRAHQLQELAAALRDRSTATPARETPGAGTRGTAAESDSSPRLRQYRRPSEPARRDLMAAKSISYLWHVEQLVSWSTPAILYSFTRRSPRPGSSAGRS